MERREHSRINVRAQGAFILRDNGKLICEFSGTVENISEVGIGIHLEKEEYNRISSYLKAGQAISFQALDIGNSDSGEVSETFCGNGKIVRMTFTENGNILACRIDDDSQDFQRYVKNKKVALYVSLFEKH